MDGFFLPYPKLNGLKPENLISSPGQDLAPESTLHTLRVLRDAYRGLFFSDNYERLGLFNPGVLGTGS